MQADRERETSFEACSSGDISRLFADYMSHMLRYVEVDDRERWRSAAFRYLEQYDAGDDRHIYAMTNSNGPVGFAMVNAELRFNRQGVAMAEFYVDPEYRKSVHGRELAENVFRRFPGDWEVSVLDGNTDALSFWRRVISRYAGNDPSENRVESYDGSILSFSSG